MELSPEQLHGKLLRRAPRILGFDAEAYFPEWQGALRRSFKQLLGVIPAKGELGVQVRGEERNKRAGGTGEGVPHREVRFVFTSEPGAEVPCRLLLPEGSAAGEKPAVVICLQSHEIGAHGSVGEWRNEEERGLVEAGHDFGLQALREGFAALVFDMRALGERADARPAEMRRGGTAGCKHAAMTALLVGRTLIGERVWDVIRAVDALVERFAGEVNVERIGAVGFSGGGVAAYYAAALEPRIAAVGAMSAICPYEASLGRMDRCACNYLPNVMHYLDMADVAGLIAPRGLAAVSGREDPLNPAGAVEEAFAEIREIYRVAGAEGKCDLAIIGGGHRPLAREMWEAFRRVSGW